MRGAYAGCSLVGAEGQNPIMQIAAECPILQAHWTPLNREIITANEDGTVRVFDVERGEEINCIEAHSKCVNSISFTRDRSCFVTASKDHYCKVRRGWMGAWRRSLSGHELGISFIFL